MVYIKSLKSVRLVFVKQNLKVYKWLNYYDFREKHNVCFYFITDERFLLLNIFNYKMS